MTAITVDNTLLEQMLDALEAAKNGLLWYQDTYPDATNDSDGEAMGKIDSALETLRAELAKPTNADPECTESSVDYWQQRGYLGSPGEWREACRLFRVRCSPEDIQRMAKLRAYIEDGLLIVSRPDNKPPTPAWHDAPTCAGLWVSDYGRFEVEHVNQADVNNFDVVYNINGRWYGPIPQDGGKS